MRTVTRSILAVLLGIALTSCGGGGGSPTAASTPAASTSGTGGSTSGSGPKSCSTATTSTPNPVPAVYVTNSGPSDISALAIDENSGALTIIDGSPFSSDGGLYAIAIDPMRAFAYTASSGGGYLRVYAITLATGALTDLSCGPYFVNYSITSIAIDPDGKFLFALGGTGSIAGFSINNDGSLTELPESPFATGSNTTAATFDPAAPYLYIANANDDTITAYTYSATGQFTQVMGSPFTTDGAVRNGGQPQSLAVDPSGTFLFSANFSDSDISVFRIDSATGTLSAVPGSPFVTGWGTLQLAVDHSGNFLYLAGGGNKIHTFAIDRSTGALTEPFLNPYVLNASLTALTIDSSGKYIYALDNSADDIVAYSINSNTGALTLLAGSPFALVPGVQGLGPTVIAASP